MKIITMAALIFIFLSGSTLEAQHSGDVVIAGDYSAAEKWVGARAAPSLVLIEVNGSSWFGFVINSRDGIIVTTRHSFRGSSGNKVSIISIENEHYEAEVIGMDQQNDFVIIKARTQGRIPALTIYPSSDLTDVSQAVVLRLNRDLSVSINPSSLTHQKYRKKDCVPSAGNGCVNETIEYAGEASYTGFSGGPALTMDGELIGLHTSQHKGNANMGFAWPIHKILEEFPEAK